MESKSHPEHTPHLPITWETKIPMLSSNVIIKQLFFILFLSTSCFLLFMILLELIEGQLTASSAGNYLLISMAILLGLFLLGVISILLIYGNRYEVRFTVNEIGVRSTTIGKTKRKNALINTLLALSGRPSSAGAGLLAAARQSELIKWVNFDNFNAYPEKLEIHLKRGKRVLMLIHCTPEIYTNVCQVIEKNS